MEKENKDVLLLYSGGGDSTLSAHRLIRSGYNVHLVHFTKLNTFGSYNVEKGAQEIIDYYGSSAKVDYVGTFDISSDFFDLLTNSDYFYLKPSEILEQYGNITYGQVQCITCRSIMYMYAIKLAKELNCSYIADGARKSQLFALEQPEFIKKYSELIQDNVQCELLTPVFDLEDDRERFYELSRNSFIGCREDKCIIGFPMDKPLTNKEIELYVNYYNKIIKPYIERTINEDRFNKPVEMVLSRKTIKLEI